MTHLLLPTAEVSNGKAFFTPGDFGRLLIDLNRASSDAIDALRLFQRLIHGQHNAEESMGMLAFDAHVGDTCCHLRAAMTDDLFDFARRNRKLYDNFLSGTVENLTAMRDNLRTTSVKLTKNRAMTKAVGLAKRETSQSFLAKLGWTDNNWAEYLPWVSLSDLSTDIQGLSLSGSSSPKSSISGTSTPSSRTGSSATAFSSSSSRAASISTYDWEEEQDWTLATTWSTRDPRTVVQYLVYAFVLSKYKSFPRSEKGCTGRLEPQMAFEEGNAMMEPYFDFGFHNYPIGTKTRIDSEFKPMQRWLSDISCSWLKTCLGPQHRHLSNIVGSTIQTSPKGLKVAATYPAYLLLRQRWAERSQELLLVDRFFCSSGHHDNIYRANVSINENYIADEPIKPNWTWTRENSHTATNGSKREPRICIIGNSVDGSQLDMNRRAMVQNSIKHNCECVENEQHVTQLKSADHDRIFLSTFAKHTQWPFTPSSGDSGDDILKTVLKNEGSLEAMFRKSRAEAEEAGITGANTRMYSAEHIFFETEERLRLKLNSYNASGKCLPLAD